MKQHLALLSLLGLAAFTGCGSSSDSGSTGSSSGALSSGSTCPDGGSSLTYDNFGLAFMTSYCIRCHGSSDTEGGIRLDTQAQVQAHISKVDRESAGGPNGINDDMPESGTKPSDAERKQLGDWLACGAK